MEGEEDVVQVPGKGFNFILTFFSPISMIILFPKQDLQPALKKFAVGK